MQKKIAACVVLYYPSEQVFSNIQSYYPYINHLITIDNSAQKKEAIENALISTFKNITYKLQDRNIGIAAALNVAARIAIDGGYDWLLTMDQDSSFAGDDLLKMIADIELIEKQYNKVGIITPYHVVTEEVIEKFEEAYKVRKIAMTSGNLLNLRAYSDAGAFEEKLFMDFVDYEYCLRLHRNNYKIIQDNKINLKHSLGAFQIRHFLGKKIGISNHNYQRRYYMTRNGLFVGAKYYATNKIFFFNVLLNNLILDPWLILFYEDNKIAKMKAIFKGVIHFLKKKTGKIQFS